MFVALVNARKVGGTDTPEARRRHGNASRCNLG
jgi:hypothetical protein